MTNIRKKYCSFRGGLDHGILPAQRSNFLLRNKILYNLTNCIYYFLILKRLQNKKRQKNGTLFLCAIFLSDDKVCAHVCKVKCDVTLSRDGLKSYLYAFYMRDLFVYFVFGGIFIHTSEDRFFMSSNVYHRAISFSKLALVFLSRVTPVSH